MTDVDTLPDPPRESPPRGAARDEPVGVSAIIVNWNTRDLLARCVDALRRHATRYTVEIIVVDNHSSDDSVQVIRDRFPGVRVIVNEDNLGYARACNVGIRAAQGRFICILNSDILIQAGCLDELGQYLEQDASVGLCSPRLVYPDGTIQVNWRKRFPHLGFTLALALGWLPIRNRLWPRWARDRLAEDPRGACRVAILAGAFWMAPRQALSRVGLLDEQFFFYGEDADWCRRFRDAGLDVVLCNRAVAIHDEGRSSAGQPVRFYIEQRRARLQYWRKHHGPAAAAAMRAVMLFHHGLRLLGLLACFPLGGFLSRACRRGIEKNGKCIRWLMQSGRPRPTCRPANTRGIEHG